MAEPAAKAAKVGKKILLATEKAFAADAVAKIQKVFDDAHYELKKLENYKSPADLIAAVADVDGMIIRSDIVNKAVLAAAPKLKIVVRAGAGYDNIELPACHEKEVVAMNTPGQNANAVAELVFAMMLASARNSFDGTSGFELRGRKMGLNGFGFVAQCVKDLAVGFGMEVFAYDPFLTPDAIKAKGATPVKAVADLFNCHYVSLHVPLTPETKDSVTKELLMKMPKGGTMINTARCEVIHEVGMLEALRERADLNYLSDVPPKNAAAVQELVGDKFMKRVIFTKKKMGAQTLEANNNAGVAAANQIVGFFERGDTKFKLLK